MRLNWKDRAAYAQQAAEYSSKPCLDLCVCGHTAEEHNAFVECDRCPCKSFKGAEVMQ